MLLRYLYIILIFSAMHVPVQKQVKPSTYSDFINFLKRPQISLMTKYSYLNTFNVPFYHLPQQRGMFQSPTGEAFYIQQLTSEHRERRKRQTGASHAYVCRKMRRMPDDMEADERGNKMIIISSL